jgi:AcrR family transcriptional regulator
MTIVRPPRAARALRAARPASARRGRQGRGVRTEEAILQATLRLLAARGVQGTSLDLLAEDVGVAKSSILWHFGSKEELLLRVAERVFDEVASGPAREILALPSIEERSAAMWRFYADTVRRRPELRRLVLYLIFETAEGRPELRARLRQLYRGMRELFAEGLSGVVSDAAQRRRLAAISVASLDGLFLQWMLDPEQIDLEALHREMRELAERARAGRRRKGGNDG